MRDMRNLGPRRRGCQDPGSTLNRSMLPDTSILPTHQSLTVSTPQTLGRSGGAGTQEKLLASLLLRLTFAECRYSIRSGYISFILQFLVLVSKEQARDLRSGRRSRFRTRGACSRKQGQSSAVTHSTNLETRISIARLTFEAPL